MLPLQDEILTIGKDTGVNKAGTFHIICRDCDSRTFQLYEDPNAYNSKPTDQMLAQIALLIPFAYDKQKESRAGAI